MCKHLQPTKSRNLARKLFDFEQDVVYTRTVAYMWIGSASSWGVLPSMRIPLPETSHHLELIYIYTLKRTVHNRRICINTYLQSWVRVLVCVCLFAKGEGCIYIYIIYICRGATPHRWEVSYALDAVCCVSEVQNHIIQCQSAYGNDIDRNSRDSTLYVSGRCVWWRWRWRYVAYGARQVTSDVYNIIHMMVYMWWERLLLWWQCVWLQSNTTWRQKRTKSMRARKPISRKWWIRAFSAVDVLIVHRYFIIVYT